MNKPDYANASVYRALLGLCEKAGLDVQYAPLPLSIYACSKDRAIQMPEDNHRFFSDEHAAIVLGHELAHYLVNPNFPELEKDEQLTLKRKMLLESECDRLGTYLCSLAAAIAEHEAREEKLE